MLSLLNIAITIHLSSKACGCHHFLHQFCSAGAPGHVRNDAATADEALSNGGRLDLSADEGPGGWCCVVATNGLRPRICR